MGKPHALALGAAPARLTGAGERVLALYYAEVADVGSRLRKYIVLHPGTSSAPYPRLVIAPYVADSLYTIAGTQYAHQTAWHRSATQSFVATPV